MTKEQVKQLFEALQNSNMEVILELIEDTEFSQRLQATFSRQSAEEEMNKMQVELLKVILKQMQTSGEYEYFETLGLQEENQSDFIDIVQYAEIPIETAKRYLEKLEDSSDKCRIIKATKNPEFIRQCVEDDSLELEIDEKSELILLIGDVEYTKQFIEKNDSKLFKGDKIKLIKSTKDPQYIKQLIEYGRFDISGLALVSLIIATEDIKYIKQSIEGDKFLFSTPQKTSLVAATKDVNYIQKYIAEQQEPLPEHEKMRLIVATGDSKYIKKCIEDGTVESLESKVILIQLTHNPEYIKEFINQHLQDLEAKRKINLIKATGDVEYIKQCIKDKTLGLTEADEIDLILQVGSEEYILQCITDGTIGLTIAQKTILSQLSKDKQLKQQFMKQYEPASIEPKIELPEGMTIGIEIETEGKFSCFLTGEFLGREIFEGWKTKHDGSLKDGVEVVSPILKGTERDSKNIYTICRMLNEIGEETSARCGGHIHIGADYLSGKDSYVNLLTLWSSAERILYEISNPPGEIPRQRSVQFYAPPISAKIEAALESGSIDITTEEDLTDFISQLKTIQNSRYSGINFLNVNLNKKNTIEFRLPNGTIDPKTWIENINLFGGIVKASEELAQIQRKPEGLRTVEEQEKIKLLGKLSSGTLTEKEILDILLTLSVSKDKKKIYEQRYEVNSRLVKNAPELEDELKLKTAKKPITPQNIETRVFTGTEIPTGQEISSAEARIRLDRARQQELLEHLPEES